MPVSEALLARAELGVAVATFYTVPAATQTIVKEVMVSNNTALAIGVELYYVESGGVADDSNIYLPVVVIAANDFLQIRSTQVLETGDTIQSLASVASGVSIMVSGAEVT